MININYCKNRLRVLLVSFFVVLLLVFGINIQKAEAIVPFNASTQIASSVSSTSATLNGTIIGSGTSASEHGFAYGTDPNLDTVIATTTSGAFLPGPYSETVSLSCNTVYYFRAYGVSIVSVFKAGSILSFTTSACEVGGGGTLYNNGMTGGPSQIPAPTNIAYVNGYPMILLGGTTSATSSAIATSTVATSTASSTLAATSTPVVSACPEGFNCVPTLNPLLPALNNFSSLFLKDLKFGQIDADVRRLQQFLNNHNFTVRSQGAGSLGSETTYFGLATKNALINFQKANSIEPAVGFFGYITRAVANGMK